MDPSLPITPALAPSQAPGEPLELAEHDPGEHFESPEQREHAAHFGMWLFLTSETLLFGALFGVYTGYRLWYGTQFHDAARLNDARLGTVNTLILVTSSFLAAWAVHAAEHDRNKTAVRCLAATVGCGLAFLGVKAFEYADHFAHGIYPGAFYANTELPGEGPRLFFTLYYFMTGLHAAHVIGGLVALSVLALIRARPRRRPPRVVSLEMGVLYWHLVDVIWIFLWPLLYLAG
jgi:cytochrome c oxidase subunit III